MSEASLPDWAKALFDPSLRNIAAWGGRGSAKSHSVASSLVLRGANKPLRIVCTREIQNSIKASVKRLLDDKIKILGLDKFYKSTETEIKGLNGTQFIFAGLRTNIESIKSMEGIDVCWVEEAQTVSKSSLKELVPTVRKPGSQLIFTWNPRNEDDPVDEMFRCEYLPPRSHVVEVNYPDNPWFPDVLREEMEYDRKRDIDKYLNVWMGGYVKNSESRVFKNWTVQEFDTEENTIFRFGADWGFANDPTVLVRMAIDVDGKKIYIDQEAYKIGCKIVNTPALFDTVEGSRKWEITADSARPETISHMQDAGFNMIGAKKGPGSIEDGIEFLKSFDIIVHPRCKHTIDELTHYKYKTDPLTDKILPIFEDKNNHVIDALRYGCESVRNIGREAEVMQGVW